MTWQHFEALVWLYVAQRIVIAHQESVIADNFRRIEENEARIAREMKRLGIGQG